MLKGSCNNGASCKHSHDTASLTDGQKKAIAKLARNTRYNRGGSCRLVDCIYGQACPHQGNCHNENCKFDKAQHNVDFVGRSNVDNRVQINIRKTETYLEGIRDRG